jgi:MerR family transcriptional regulator, redox-sensitive transcriptional activator SoxR
MGVTVVWFTFMDEYGKTSTMVEVKRFTVGQVAERTGVATSALRFYEEHGLIRSERTKADHRRYRPDVIRRVSFIRVAQKVGLSLDEIRSALDQLPKSRTPSKRDWERLAASWQPLLDDRIAVLSRMRTDLASCIGCGCLSLRSCRLWNMDDAARSLGAGPRYLLSDERPAVNDSVPPVTGDQ